MPQHNQFPPVNARSVEAAILQIEASLDRAQGVKNEMEAGIYGGEPSGGHELPDEALRKYLEEASTRTVVLIDLLGLAGTQQQFAATWRTFLDAPKGLRDTKFHPDVDWLESKPLDYLQNLIGAIRVFTDPVGAIRDVEQGKLEQILRDTAVLVKRRGVTPANEIDVQNVMHDYLSAYFPRYTTKPHVHGSLKRFKPDGGVVNLKAAIEFKFADSNTEVLTALDGFFEDISGYSGSDDWTTFYAVVYQTEPFVSESRFQAEFDRAGASNWKPILVNWNGKRKVKTKLPSQSSE
jgi:hypothetical protein